MPPAVGEIKPNETLSRAETMSTTQTKSRYVLGFMFDMKRERVALIRKNKPEWQKGLLNGIGGKIETTDATDSAAMTREFMEEAGVTAPTWRHYAVMRGRDWEVECYAIHGDLSELKSETDEAIEIVGVGCNPAHCVENLPWLISLAIDHLTDGRPRFTTIDYDPGIPDPEAAVSKALEALKELYEYESRRSSPETAWDCPMMTRAREALAALTPEKEGAKLACPGCGSQNISDLGPQQNLFKRFKCLDCCNLYDNIFTVKVAV